MASIDPIEILIACILHDFNQCNYAMISEALSFCTTCRLWRAVAAAGFQTIIGEMRVIHRTCIVLMKWIHNISRSIKGERLLPPSILLCATDVTSPCLHRAYSCSTVSPGCKVGSGQLHVYIACSYINTTSTSWMGSTIYDGMLSKNGLGWGWVLLQELNTQRLLVGRELDAQRLWQACEELMTYDRVPPTHYELLRRDLSRSDIQSSNLIGRN